MTGGPIPLWICGMACSTTIPVPSLDRFSHLVIQLEHGRGVDLDLRECQRAAARELDRLIAVHWADHDRRYARPEPL